MTKLQSIALTCGSKFLVSLIFGKITQNICLSARGMNAAATLADYLTKVGEGAKVTEADVREMVSDGEVSFETFAAAMDDDFNTALAIAAIFDFTKAVNTHAAQAEQTAVQEALRLLEALDEVIACIKPRQKGLNDELVDKLMDLLIEVRQQARQRKDWGTADYIRDALKECGIALEDGADAVRWKILE